ncbi:MAG TPA: tetratricopeptide repeat protein [Myxococcota bacterium]|nr:tetratricopeptide repeat protein [Myxococcota bacterium]
MNVARHVLPVTIALTVIGLSSFGCGTSMTSIEMEPLEFQAVQTADGLRVETMDPERLFESGSNAFDAGDFVEASRLFGLVADRFPDSAQGEPALFNLGLSRLRGGRPGEAVTAFRRYIDSFPPEPQDVLPRLRLIEALLDSGEWADAEAEIKVAIDAPGLTPANRLELEAGLTRSLRKQNRLQEALDASARAREIHDSHLTDPSMRANYSAAMAAFESGEIWHDLFVSIKLVLPKDRMEKDLTDKAAMFMKAQAEYMRTVRIGNIYWSSKAGVRIGQLYEEFYADIMNAEIPPGLSNDDLALYRAELRRQARPMLVKAVDLYERNMEVCRKFGAREEWFTEMKTRLARLKSLLAELE